MTDHDYHLDRIATALEALLARLPDAILTQATKPPADFDGAQYAFDAKMGDPLTALGDLSPFAELTRNVPIGIAMNDAQPGEELRVKLTFKAPAKPDPQLVAERQAAYDAALAHYDAIALRGTRKQKDDACRAIDEAEQALTRARFAVPDPVPAPADTKPGDDYAPRIRWSKVDPRSRELARLRTDAKHRAQAAKTADQREAALREYRQAKSEASRRQTALRQLWREDVIDIVNGQLVVFTGTGAQLKWRSDYLQAPDYVLTLPE